jgi:polyisoprenoid-binding protein YceI
MRNAFKATIVICFTTATTGFTVLTGNWNLDPNYNIRFSGNKVEGTITGLTGKIIFEPSEIKKAMMEVEVDAASVKTGNSMKDNHAKGEDWLDTEKYPKIKFTSSAFTSLKEGYEVTGNLEMHGTVKTVVIPFQFSQTNGKGVFTGKFKIDRKEYGVKGNFMASAMSGEMEIELRIPVTKN